MLSLNRDRRDDEARREEGSPFFWTGSIAQHRMYTSAQGLDSQQSTRERLSSPPRSSLSSSTRISTASRSQLRLACRRLVQVHEHVGRLAEVVDILCAGHVVGAGDRQLQLVRICVAATAKGQLVRSLREEGEEEAEEDARIM